MTASPQHPLESKRTNSNDPRIVHKDVDFAFGVENNLDDTLNILIARDIQRQSLDRVVFETLHGCNITRCRVDFA